MPTIQHKSDKKIGNLKIYLNFKMNLILKLKNFNKVQFNVGIY